MREASKGFSRELQVGLFVFTALLVVAAFSFRITETPIFYSGTKITAYLDDATGLFEKSKVKLAGIDVGLVTAVKLKDGRAQITLTIKKEFTIPQGAKVVPRPLGILGDKYLEIVLPAKEEKIENETDAPPVLIFEEEAKLWNFVFPSVWAQQTNPPASRPLKEGDVIQSVNSGATIDDLTRQLGDVSDDLKSISGNLRGMLEGKDMQSPLGRTLRNAESASLSLDKILSENRQDLRQILRSLAKLSKSLESIANDKSQSGLSKDIQTLAKSANRLAESVKNIESITAKIDRGEGTLGKLVNDPVTASEFNKALITINAALDRAERTRVIVEAIPEMNIREQNVKTYVGLTLSPRDNTSYIGQIVVTPKGTSKPKITRTRVDGGPETVTEEIEEDPNGLHFSFQYAKRFWDTSFRVGLFENTGGLALDQHLLNNSLKASAEIYDFSGEDKPQLKFVLAYSLLEVFKIHAGLDQSLNANKRNVFVGFGLSFSDEDIKTILLFPGVP